MVREREVCMSVYTEDGKVVLEMNGVKMILKPEDASWMGEQLLLKTASLGKGRLLCFDLDEDMGAEE